MKKEINPRDYYTQNYRQNMYEGFVGWIFRYHHVMMEKDLHSNQEFSRVLELGSTHGIHHRYVRHVFREYIVSDLDISGINQAEFENDPRYVIEEIDAEDLFKIPDDSFDRVIATCLVLHLENLEKTLKEWRRITKNEGILTFYVHSEPGFLLRILRFLSTNLKMNMKGYKFLDFVYTEHKIHYLAVKHTIRKIFGNDEIKIRSFPPACTWNFSLWKIVQIELNKN